MASYLQMMVRMYHWDEWQVYRFYNLNHEDYPNLPAPPNAKGLQTFMIACLDVTIEQMNAENNPKGAKRTPRTQRGPQ